MLSPVQRIVVIIGLMAAVAGTVFGIHYAFQTVFKDPHEESPHVGRHIEELPPEDPPYLVKRAVRFLASQSSFPPYAVAGPGALNVQFGAAARVIQTINPPQYFRGLPPPELVLMLSGQTYGYLQPCGCSRPQLGGLERRFELLAHLHARGWKVSSADLGDIAAKHVNEQGLIKYETSMQVLHDMNTAVIGMGMTEMAMPLERALGYAQNYQPPFVLAANLNDKAGQFPGMFQAWRVDDAQPGRAGGVNPPVAALLPGGLLPPRAGTRLRAGYIGMVGESVAKKAKERDATLVFDPVDRVMPDVLRQVQAERPDILVLLFQGTLAEAKELAGKHPQFHVILAVDDKEEPSALPEEVGDTMLISIGHKGRYAGLVGVWPHAPDQANRRFDLRYQLVSLSEHYELPDAETNQARDRLKDYVLRVHQGDFLTKYPRSSHPLQLDFPEATFVGAEACKDCHRKAYEVWSKSRHSHAYETLIDYGRPVIRDERKEPIGRQFDPDCVRCHTTGFEHHGGFVNESATPKLKGNGCENCHGPASLHVAKPYDIKYSVPLHRSVLAKEVENTCRRCHDGDNDPHFDLQKYWPKIKHGRD